MATRVKICGLKNQEAVDASVSAGAAYLGFNFITRSKRFITPTNAAALEVPVGLAKVALTMDATDDELSQILGAFPADILQLHGHETSDRVNAVRNRFGLPVIKAVGIADAADVALLDTYSAVADILLVDTKPPTQGDLPGGTGLPFDWRLLAGRRWSKPWMLAGGLKPENVAEAIRLTGATQVDVASGVEDASGTKNPAQIEAFVAAAHAVHPLAEATGTTTIAT